MRGLEGVEEEGESIVVGGKRRKGWRPTSTSTQSSFEVPSAGEYLARDLGLPTSFDEAVLRRVEV